MKELISAHPIYNTVLFSGFRPPCYNAGIMQHNYMHDMYMS